MHRRPTPPIAVTFDLWATVLGHPARGGAERHACRVAALHDVLRERGDAVESTAIDRLMRDEWRRYNQIWADERRTLLNHERLTWMLAELGVDALDEATVAQVCRAFDESIFRGVPGLADGAIDALQALSDRGIVLGVVSDTSYTTGRTLRRVLDELGVLRFFEPEALVFSDEVGRSKPDVALFERCLAALGLDDPARAAHIGDNPKTDVLGANDAGLTSVLYRPDDTREAPTQPPADLVVRHFDELLPALGFTP